MTRIYVALIGSYTHGFASDEIMVKKEDGL
jgi:hypothetical protein